MKLTIKTLKGGKFDIVVEDTHTVAQVKEVIESTKTELPAATTKLIHSGKILKDDDIISTCGIKESDFLVVMVTKAKKVAASVDTSASAAAAAPPAATPKAAEGEAKTDESSVPATSATPAPTTDASASTPAAPSRPTAETFPDEVVTNLTGMGFPEAEVRHCLRVANGNPDVAVEYLTNGIPDGVTEAASAMGAHTPASSSTTGGAPLQSLRNHPQFDALRRLVQSNPAMLQQVLTQIGQQQPELLQEINANQGLFLEMMNEPVTETSATTTATGARSASGTDTPRPDMMMDGMGSPSQMAQMIQGMSAEELNQMAAMMGIQPEQLRQTVQAIGRLPPEQVNQFMMQAMGGADGMMGGGGGPQVLHLTADEMAAVDRLTEMGFDRSEAAQAFLACDKNEALAANLLMDSMGDGGFGGGGFGGGGNDDDGNDDDDDENMYD